MTEWTVATEAAYGQGEEARGGEEDHAPIVVMDDRKRREEGVATFHTAVDAAVDHRRILVVAVCHIVWMVHCHIFWKMVRTLLVVMAHRIWEEAGGHCCDDVCCMYSVLIHTLFHSHLACHPFDRELYYCRHRHHHHSITCPLYRND